MYENKNHGFDQYVGEAVCVNNLMVLLIQLHSLVGKLCTDVAYIARRNVTRISIVLGILSFRFKLWLPAKHKVG